MSIQLLPTGLRHLFLPPLWLEPRGVVAQRVAADVAVPRRRPPVDGQADAHRHLHHLRDQCRGFRRPSGAVG